MDKRTAEFDRERDKKVCKALLDDILKYMSTPYDDFEKEDFQRMLDEELAKPAEERCEELIKECILTIEEFDKEELTLKAKADY